MSHGGAERWDVIVVGGGPAGLSAALVLGRARRSVLVLDDGEPRNAAARKVGGYLGLEDIAPLDLLARGRDQVTRYGVEVRDARAVSACEAPSGGFEVTVADGSVLRSRKLLLCTGVRDELPDLDGARDLYGRGVHHCPYCDGWEHGDGRLAAYGQPEDSVPLALSLLTWSSNVTVLTDGAAVPGELAGRVERNGLKLRTERVLRLEGGAAGRRRAADGRPRADPSDAPAPEDEAVLRRAVLAGGDPVELDALFFHTRRAQSSDLPRVLGCTLDDREEVVIGRGQGTGVRGLFLAGDASGDVQFVVVAAAEGARAAVHVNREMQAEERS